MTSSLLLSLLWYSEGTQPFTPCGNTHTYSICVNTTVHSAEYYVYSLYLKGEQFFMVWAVATVPDLLVQLSVGPVHRLPTVTQQLKRHTEKNVTTLIHIHKLESSWSEQQGFISPSMMDLWCNPLYFYFSTSKPPQSSSTYRSEVYWRMHYIKHKIKLRLDILFPPCMFSNVKLSWV